MFSSPGKVPRGVKEVARKMGINEKVASKTWTTMSSYTKNVTDNFSMSRSKLLKRSSDKSSDDKYAHNYQRGPSLSTTTININTTNNPSNANARESNLRPRANQTSFARLTVYCLAFFALIFILNFIFTQNLRGNIHHTPIPLTNGGDRLHVVNPKTNKTADEIRINYDEGLPALIDQLETDINDHHKEELDQLFQQIHQNQTNPTTKTDEIVNIHEDPLLEEKSMQSLHDNIMQQQEHIESANPENNENTIMALEPHLYHPYPSGFSDPSAGLYYLALIADMDKTSKVSQNKWRSYLQHVKLLLYRVPNRDGNGVDYKVQIEWTAPPFNYDQERTNLITSERDLKISSNKKSKKNDTCCYAVAIDGYYNEKGRGMELSELLWFDGKLYSFDDRTGIVYEISKEFEAIPRQIVLEGDGNIPKGMKIEWATYKPDEELLYIGSIGREYTNHDGSKIRKLGLLWVATMDKDGRIEHHDWTERYIKLREVTATLFPGYLWIEAVEWSAIHRKWFILPRYLSFAQYDDELTENRGCNLLIVATEDFGNVELVWIRFDEREVSESSNRILLNEENINSYKSMSHLNAAQLRSMSVKQENMKVHLQQNEKAFSSLRFLPNTNDTVFVALQTVERKGEIIDSYLNVIDITGDVYLQSQRIPFQRKYEGVAVL